MEKQHLVFHIGLPKTGSTFLQTQVFPFLHDVYFVADKALSREISVEEKIRLLRKYVRNSKCKTIVISDESLCGNPSDSKSFDDLEKLIREIDPAYRISIIAIIKRQDRFVDSFYVHHVNKGGTLELEKFFSLSPNSIDIVGKTASEGTLAKGFCDYTRFLKLAEIENREHTIGVTIIPYELMVADLRKFLDSVVGVTGSKVRIPKHIWQSGRLVNRRTSYVEFVIKQKLNRTTRIKLRGEASFSHYIYSGSLRIARLITRFYWRPFRVVSKEKSRQIQKYYAARNSELARLCGLDLVKYKYFDQDP